MRSVSDRLVFGRSGLFVTKRVRSENKGMDRGGYGKEDSTGIFVDKREGDENMSKIDKRLDWILFRLGEIQDSQRKIEERLKAIGDRQEANLLAHSHKPKNHRLETWLNKQ